MNDALDAICHSLGVPSRVFQGEPTETPMKLLVEYEAARLERLRKQTEPVIIVSMRRVLEELSWKPLFLCSPRGWAKVRQPLPKITVQWEESK